MYVDMRLEDSDTQHSANLTSTMATNLSKEQFQDHNPACPYCPSDTIWLTHSIYRHLKNHKNV